MPHRIPAESRDILSLPSEARDDELLAIVLTGGHRPERALRRAAELATLFGDIPTLARTIQFDLTGPLGNRALFTLVAARELLLRAQRGPDTRPILRTPGDVAVYLQPRIGALPREEFHVLCLNIRNRLLRDACVAKGSVDCCPVDPREVFRAGITSGCSALILAHNHPSGDLTPSEADLALTRELRDAARVLRIRLLDSVVVTASRHLSAVESGLF